MPVAPAIDLNSIRLYMTYLQRRRIRCWRSLGLKTVRMQSLLVLTNQLHMTKKCWSESNIYQPFNTIGDAHWRIVQFLLSLAGNWQLLDIKYFESSSENFLNTIRLGVKDEYFMLQLWYVTLRTNDVADFLIIMDRLQLKPVFHAWRGSRLQQPQISVEGISFINCAIRKAIPWLHHPPHDFRRLSGERCLTSHKSQDVKLSTPDGWDIAWYR